MGSLPLESRSPVIRAATAAGYRVLFGRYGRMWRWYVYEPHCITGPSYYGERPTKREAVAAAERAIMHATMGV